MSTRKANRGYLVFMIKAKTIARIRIPDTTVILNH
jgi:hypothetical protein